MPSAKTGGLPAGEAADTYFRQGGNAVYYQVSKEFFDKLPNAWFVGFLRNEDAPYAFAVVVEEGGSGAGAAGNVAAQVLNALVNGY